MRGRTLAAGALACMLAACGRACAEPRPGGSDDAGAAAAAPSHAPPGFTGAAALKGPLDRARAERIGFFYAQVHWAAYRPRLATAFNDGHGDYRVVVGFDGRPDAASVLVRIADGEVVEASLAPGEQ